MISPSLPTVTFNLRDLGNADWVATVIGPEWSGDISLYDQKGSLCGCESIGRDGAMTIQLSLGFDLSGRGNLELQILRQKRTVFFASSWMEEDTHSFLRFEFRLPPELCKPSLMPFFDGSRLTVQADRRSDIKRQFSNSAFGLSYLPVLRSVLETKRNPRVLEWGPGRSSIMFAEWSIGARILGIEHSAQWNARCFGIMERFDNFEVSFQPISLRPGESGCYVTFPFHRPDVYDIIFVDGRLRCDCLAVARKVLAPHGIVLLHDAHRKNYGPGIKLFSRCDIISGTAILQV